MSKSFGKYHDENAVWKPNVKDPYTNFVNSVTRRNREIAEGSCLQIQNFPNVNAPHPSPPPASSPSDSIDTSAEWSRTSSKYTKCTFSLIKNSPYHSWTGQDFRWQPFQSKLTADRPPRNRLQDRNWIRNVAWRWVALYSDRLSLQVPDVTEGHPSRPRLGSIQRLPSWESEPKRGCISFPEEVLHWIQVLWDLIVKLIIYKGRLSKTKR